MSARAVLGLTLLVALALLVAVLGFKLSGWRLTRAQETVERVTDDNVARHLEVDGTKQLTAAADRLATATNNLRSADHAQDIAAARDPDAQGDLPAGVVDRLRADRERLCASGVRCVGDAPEVRP